MPPHLVSSQEGIPFEGNYSGWLERKATRLQQEGAYYLHTQPCITNRFQPPTTLIHTENTHSPTRQNATARDDSKRQKALERELEWMRMSPKARQTKSKARISSYEQMVRADEDARESARSGPTNIYIPPGPPLGTKVVEAENLAKWYRDRLLWDKVSFSLPRGGVVGVIGANGVGKSTLFKLIAGLEKPDQGTLTVGDTVKVMYVDQNRENLQDPNKTVYDLVSEGAEQIELGKRAVNSRAYLGCVVGGTFGLKVGAWCGRVDEGA